MMWAAAAVAVVSVAGLMGFSWWLKLAHRKVELAERKVDATPLAELHARVRQLEENQARAGWAALKSR